MGKERAHTGIDRVHTGIDRAHTGIDRKQKMFHGEVNAVGVAGSMREK